MGRYEYGKPQKPHILKLLCKRYDEAFQILALLFRFSILLKMTSLRTFVQLTFRIASKPILLPKWDDICGVFGVRFDSIHLLWKFPSGIAKTWIAKVESLISTLLSYTFRDHFLYINLFLQYPINWRKYYQDDLYWINYNYIILTNDKL